MSNFARKCKRVPHALALALNYAIVMLSLAVTACSSTSKPLPPVPPSLAWRVLVNPDSLGRHLNAIWCIGADTIVAVGDQGTVVSRIDGVWSMSNAGTSNTLLAIWGSASDDYYVVGESGTIIHWVNGSWTDESDPLLTGNSELTDVFGFDQDLIYVCGRNGTMLSNLNGTWEAIDVPSEVYQSFEEVWGYSSAELNIVGDEGKILKYYPARSPSSRWEKCTGGLCDTFFCHLTSVWGTSATNLYAVGYTDNCTDGPLHFMGGKWVVEPLLEIYSFLSLWGPSDTCIFAVGLGAAYKSDGSTWARQELPVTKTLLGICGFGPELVYAVGRDGTILEYSLR